MRMRVPWPAKAAGTDGWIHRRAVPRVPSQHRGGFVERADGSMI